MKGLLIKDWKLMKNQKQFFLLIFIISLVLLNSNSYFVVMYMTMLCAFFTISTISYDEYDNGGAYLFTLPFTRKLYVREKYALGGLLAVIPWAVTSLLVFLYSSFTHRVESTAEWWAVVSVYLVLVLLMEAVMLPIYLKYGNEKGRIVMIVTMAVLSAGAVGTIKLLNKANIPMEEIIETVTHTHIAEVALLAVLFLVAVFMVSYRISVGIVEKKEY